MPERGKPRHLYQLLLKSTGEPSVRVPAFHLFTEDEAARLNETVLANASVDWQLVPEDDERTRDRARGMMSRRTGKREYRRSRS